MWTVFKLEGFVFVPFRTININENLQKKEIMYHKCIGLTLHQSSELLYFFDKLENVAGQKLGLFKGSKVTASRHESVG